MHTFYQFLSAFCSNLHISNIAPFKRRQAYHFFQRMYLQ